MLDGLTVVIGPYLNIQRRPSIAFCRVLPRLVVSARSPRSLVVYHPHEAAVILVSLEQLVGIKGPAL